MNINCWFESGISLVGIWHLAPAECPRGWTSRTIELGQNSSGKRGVFEAIKVNEIEVQCIASMVFVMLCLVQWLHERLWVAVVTAAGVKTIKTLQVWSIAGWYCWRRWTCRVGGLNKMCVGAMVTAVSEQSQSDLTLVWKICWFASIIWRRWKLWGPGSKCALHGT